MDAQERRELVTHRLKALLQEGPATIPELQAELPHLSLRRVQVAMWVLTYSGQARKIGHIPCDDPHKHSKGNFIYALATTGRRPSGQCLE